MLFNYYVRISQFFPKTMSEAKVYVHPFETHDKAFAFYQESVKRISNTMFVGNNDVNQVSLFDATENKIIHSVKVTNSIPQETLNTDEVLSFLKENCIVGDRMNKFIKVN